MSRHRYTKEQERFLVENVKGVFYKDLAEDFNSAFKTNLNENAIRQKCYALGVKNHYTLGARENYVPPSTKPVGAESVDEDGNPIIKIAQPRQWKKKSHVVWEMANGPVPKNHYVIFLNQNKKDCRLENLALVSRSTFYKLVHSGMYSENEDITRVGITLTLLEQKIEEHEKSTKDANNIKDLKRKIKELNKENEQLRNEAKMNRLIAESFYEWGKKHRDKFYAK